MWMSSLLISDVLSTSLTRIFTSCYSIFSIFPWFTFTSTSNIYRSSCINIPVLQIMISQHRKCNLKLLQKCFIILSHVPTTTSYSIALEMNINIHLRPPRNYNYMACSLVHFFAVFSNSFGFSRSTVAMDSSRGLSELGLFIIFNNVSKQCVTFNVGDQSSYNIEAQISPVDDLMFGWYILVWQVIVGGLNGYVSGKEIETVNFPPAQGVSSGPMIVTSHSWMFDSEGRDT